MGRPFKSPRELHVAVRFTVAEWGTIADVLDVVGLTAIALRIRIIVQEEFRRVRGMRKSKAPRR